MKFRIIGYTLGILLIIVGMTELIPALVDWKNGHHNARIFLEGSLLSLFFGGLLLSTNQGFEKSLNVRQAFLLTTLSWFFVSLFASFPLYLSDLKLSFTDAFFEALSGITTTGSTVLSGLDGMSHGVLLWRSIIQWIGGIGIIGFGIVFLPFLRIGGMQLFQTESSEKSDKIMPRSSSLITSLFQIYCALTALCALAYYNLGMTGFDAINHALTTIPTGGYSTHDASFGYFESPYLQITATVFMLMGGIPFILYIKLLYHKHFSFFKDEQFKMLLAMITAFVLILTIWLWQNSNYGIGDSLRYVAFNVVSIITTTGYATTDYTLWGPFAAIFFFFITYLGACAGSTTGGLKVMRLVIVSKTVGKQFKTLLYPHGVFITRYQRKTIDQNVTTTVLGFLGMYVFANVIMTIALSMTGLDFTTAISGAATALANVGPGIGNTIGPAGNFASLSDTAKWLLCSGMLLGRLEILTVIVLFKYEYWRG